MTEKPHRGSAETVRVIRAFLATYDVSDASDRQVAIQIRGRLHSELYRREREQCPEWIDHGGEG